MSFELTEHAEKRLRRRRIELAWVEEVLHAPEWLEEDLTDPFLQHRLASIPQAGYRILRVVCDPTVEPIVVITAFFDADARTER